MEMLQESYVGKIMDVNDPDHLGRCKVKVYGLFGDEDGAVGSIPTEDLPWAYPFNPIVFGSKGSGAFSSPKKDQMVRVLFDGDQYHPRYYSLEDLDEDLKSAIQSEGYENFHALIFDSTAKLKMFYSKKSGILIHLDGTIWNILPDNSMLFDVKNSTATIELRGTAMTLKTTATIDITSNNTITHNSNLVHVNGVQTRLGANPIYSNMNGEQAMILFTALATALDAKLPLTPGANSGLVQTMKELILSASVKTTP